MKKTISAALALAAALSLTACGNASSSSTPAAEEAVTAEESKANAEAKMTEHITNTNKTIGISLPAQELERWNSDGDYLKERFETVGYTVELKYANNDAEQQKTDIEGFVDESVDLLLIAPVDCNNLADTLDKAKENGISVVDYDRLIMGTEAVTYFISFDNYAAGKMQGEYFVNSLGFIAPNSRYNIEFLTGDENDINALYFFNGQYDVLKDYIDAGSINIKSGRTEFKDVTVDSWATDEAKKTMEELISSYYTSEHLDAVICANDSTALGAVQAIDSLYKQDNYPLVTGQDGDIENLRNIVDGKQAMTVFKNVREEASAAFIVCKSILSGDTPAAGLVKEMPFEVTYDTSSYNNDKKYIMSYLLEPTVITADNLQELVDTGLYQWDSDNKYLESVK